jgi:hypothetical protein
MIPLEIRGATPWRGAGAPGAQLGIVPGIFLSTIYSAITCCVSFLAISRSRSSNRAACSYSNLAKN